MCLGEEPLRLEEEAEDARWLSRADRGRPREGRAGFRSIIEWVPR